ncbi:MAG: acetone carboxylase subunit gamma [Solirubrobacteraceae bacterium]
MAQRMNEYLEVEEGRIRCTRCAADICAAAENYKLWVLQERGPVTDIPGVGDPTPYGMQETLEFRRYYCPGCAVQLETEISRPELEPLWDIELDADRSPSR